MSAAQCFAAVTSLLILPLTLQAADVPLGAKLHAKQEIVRGNGAEPATLDPAKMQGVPESNLALDLFEGLMSTDPEGEIVPGAAEKWEVRDGGKLWTFTLRRNAKWSDGSPLSAQDFEFAWKRLVDPKTASPYSWFPGQASHIANGAEIAQGKKPPAALGVKALDDRTLQVRLDEPIGFFLKTLAHSSLLPVPKKIVEQYGDKWTDSDKLVSNGAYRLATRVVNERIVLVRNPNYWDNAKTVIDKVTFLPIVQPSAEYQRYRAGAIDMSANGGVPIDQIKQIRATIPDELKLWPQLGTYYYELNLRVKPFDDWRVRKALALAIDRKIIVERVTNTGETKAYTFTPPITAGMKQVRTPAQEMTQPQREELARKLLAEAGYGPDKPLKFPLLYNTQESHKKLALAMSAMWRLKLGVRAELTNQEWKTYLDSRTRGDFTVARAGWVADYNEPSTMLDVFTTGNGQNHGQYSNPAFDETVRKAKLTANESQRAKLYQDAEQILAQDAPMVTVFFYSNKMLVKPWVRGYGRDPQGFVRTKELYILAH
ncbi:MAG: ABC transporter substrate-binding protein [Betaproteobacteria bacterium]|nr:ABC transporter substrate-binding protein [Betaproteobacteria bacterium]